MSSIAVAQPLTLCQEWYNTMEYAVAAVRAKAAYDDVLAAAAEINVKWHGIILMGIKAVLGSIVHKDREPVEVKR